MTASIRIVVADDQPLVLDGIATILGAQPGFEVIGRVRNGSEAVDVVIETRPDVVCLDIEMPELDGIGAAEQIQQRTSTEIIMLTTFNREDYLMRALRAGASGFLLKTATPEQLAEGIRTVASGEALLAPEVTRHLIQAAVRDDDDGGAFASRPSPAPEEPSLPHPLTDREREVLALAALGLSNTEIGERLFIGAETVKSHVSAVLAKLGLRNRVQAVAYAYQHGIVEPHS